jgi:hypothetical protein
MGTHVSISGTEAADRLEIRELVDAYAHCADRRDAKGKCPFLLRIHTSLCSWMQDPRNRLWICTDEKTCHRYLTN